MSGTEHKSGPEGDAGDPDSPSGDFQLPEAQEEGATGEVKLRRGLLGYRKRDVDAARAAQQAEMDDLRRDVTALWLAFGQHERTIRQMLVAVERITGVRIDSPGGRADQGLQVVVDEGAAPAGPESGQGPHGAPTDAGPAAEAAEGNEEEAPGAASIGEQLSDLDQVLAAIEGATRSLERTYHQQIAEGEEDRQEDPDDPESGESGEDDR